MADPTHESFPPLREQSVEPLAQSVGITKWHGGNPSENDDLVAIEAPLEIRIRSRSVSVTMRTPGHDVELAAGFLLAEGLLRSRDDVYRIAHCGAEDEANVIDVTVAPHVPVDFASLTRHVFSSSSCGLCGRATIENLQRRLPPIESNASIAAATLSALPDRMRAAQATFDQTGGLHAAALFDASGELRVLREDVGRHNAVDKVLGHAMLRGWPMDAAVLLVSGRTSFEIVQKALAARVPIVAAVGAPSSLAVELSAAGGITLAGFVRDGRFNVYANPRPISTSA